MIHLNVIDTCRITCIDTCYTTRIYWYKLSVSIDTCYATRTHMLQTVSIDTCYMTRICWYKLSVSIDHNITWYKTCYLLYDTYTHAPDCIYWYMLSVSIHTCYTTRTHMKWDTEKRPCAMCFMHPVPFIHFLIHAGTAQ